MPSTAAASVARRSGARTARTSLFARPSAWLCAAMRSARSSSGCSALDAQRRGVVDDQPVVAAAHQLAVRRQVRQQRDAAVRHRLEHRHRHRVALRQAEVPARAATSVRPAPPRRAGRRSAPWSCRPSRPASACVRARSEPSLATTSRASGQRGSSAAKASMHALRCVDRLEPAVGEEQPRLLPARQRGQRLEPEREGHHLAGAECAHALGSCAANRWCASAQARSTRRSSAALHGAALRRDQHVRPPGRADQPAGERPAAMSPARPACRAS